MLFCKSKYKFIENLVGNFEIEKCTRHTELGGVCVCAYRFCNECSGFFSKKKFNGNKCFAFDASVCCYLDSYRCGDIFLDDGLTQNEKVIRREIRKYHIHMRMRFVMVIFLMTTLYKIGIFVNQSTNNNN